MGAAPNSPDDGLGGIMGQALDGRENGHHGRERVRGRAPSQGQMRRVAGSEVGQRMQGYAPNGFTHNPRQYFDELRKTDVDESTIKLLTNLFSRDLILGKLDESDTHEAKMLAYNIIDMVYAEHPTSRSTIVGDRRKMLSGDYDNGLKPLSGLQKAWIEMAVFSFVARISRSEGGFQQEMNSKSINVTENRQARTSTGGIGSLLPGGGN